VGTSIVVRLVTLILGAVLGAHWREVESWFLGPGDVEANPTEQLEQGEGGRRAPFPGAQSDG